MSNLNAFNPNRRILQKLTNYRYRILYRSIPELAKFQLIVDFEPVINFFQLEQYSNFVLCHWQAQPRGYREYAYFSKINNAYNYQVIPYDKINILTDCQVVPLQIDETIYKTVPTAVILFPDSCIVADNLEPNKWLLNNSFDKGTNATN